jgi:hypothetical protein
MGQDLIVLQNSHRSLAETQFGNIKKDISTFIDDVYAPFIINFVLKDELQKYQSKQSSLYGAIEAAGKIGGKKETQEAMDVMFEFQESANNKIESKRSELLAPILAQEAEVLANIKLSYDNVIYGNGAVTNYLESIQKMKKTQGQALEGVGLKNIVDNVNKSMLNVSNFVSNALAPGKDIDIKSDTAFKEINAIFQEITNIGKKN